MLAALAAMVVSHAHLSVYYDYFLQTPLSVSLGEFVIDKPILLWINDGLMAVFFLLIGLELKRAILEGQLSSKDRLILPLVAAIGGFIIPAFIYFSFNCKNPDVLSGWAIPSATDIAFALGVLALLGSRVPLVLKIFLTTLAIIDDLAAIVVIALFYSSDLTAVSFALAAIGISTLFALNRLGVVNKKTYILVGIIVWVCVLKSGVHAALAGVILAFSIPLLSKKKDTTQGHSVLREREHSLHPWVALLCFPFLLSQMLAWI